MTGKVIQGVFLGGQPKLAAVQPRIAAPPPIQAKTAAAAPATAFAGRPPGPPIPAFAARPSGPPAPAFGPRPGAVQRHGAGGAFAIDSGALGLASGGGKPLPDAVRGQMEAALGADFSNVRVHVGPQAERIGAIAFTVGSDIYFAPSRYQPDTVPGQQLLGHELAHVVQQRAGRVRNPLGSGLAVVQDHALEAEADRLGPRAAMHRVAAQAKMPPRAAQPSAPVRIPPPGAAGLGSYGRTAAGGVRPAAPLVYQPQAAAVTQPKPAATAAGGQRPFAGKTVAGAPMQLKCTPPISPPRVIGAGGAGSRRPVIQRDVGFEYETNADTYSTLAPLTAAARQNAAMPAGANPLPKGTVLIGNMSGLHAKSDLGGAGVGSNLELETDAFPETAAGRVALHRALKRLERFCLLINAKRANQPQFRASHLAAAFGGTAGMGNLYIRALGNITGNPQASVGVRVDRVAELMERTVGGPTAGPHVPGGGAPITRLELGIQNAPDFRNVGDAPRRVRQGIANYVAAYAGAAALPGGFPSDALVGLCALMLSYIVRGQVGQMYAKQIAPLMTRTDFGSIFNNDVSALERVFLSAGNGAEFLAMWTQILAHVGVAGGMAGQLFALEPASVAGLGLNISGSLTRRRWIRGISQGNDRLTPATFPSVPARPQLFGLGGMGAAHDNVGPGGAIAAPILELRRMRQGVTPHEFTEIAMGLFDYVVALNSAGAGVHPAYARAARPVKAVKNAQKLSYWLAGGR